MPETTTKPSKGVVRKPMTPQPKPTPQVRRPGGRVSK